MAFLALAGMTAGAIVNRCRLACDFVLLHKLGHQTESRRHARCRRSWSSHQLRGDRFVRALHRVDTRQPPLLRRAARHLPGARGARLSRSAARPAQLRRLGCGLRRLGVRTRGLGRRSARTGPPARRVADRHGRLVRGRAPGHRLRAPPPEGAARTAVVAAHRWPTCGRSPRRELLRQVHQDRARRRHESHLRSPSSSPAASRPGRRIASG